MCRQSCLGFPRLQDPKSCLAQGGCQTQPSSQCPDAIPKAEMSLCRELAPAGSRRRRRASPWQCVPSRLHGVGGEAELQVGAEVLRVPEPAHCPGHESGHGRSPGAPTQNYSGISAPPAGPVRTEAAGSRRGTGALPGSVPSPPPSAALCQHLPRALPAPAVPRTQRPGIAAGAFLILSVPRCPWLAQRCCSTGSWRRALGR